ncbi:MAG TPA: zeta toxin family protein [Candidatus Aquilonibacter sp.]|nr:zeta toxin family protein [Candidatus Aquilonibacter sp.]
MNPPRCIVIAGPNGAGKTTFAREFLPKDAGVIHFVNADLIAAGLSPLRPELAALAGGRLLLTELDRLAKARTDFAFESTLSGLGYLGRLQKWKAAGYRIEMVFLRLHSPQLALRRIAVRVKQGGHDVPRADVLRRFARGWRNFEASYKPLADAWAVYDNSGDQPQLLETKR